MLWLQNHTAHCSCHARAPQNPRRPFRPAVCPRRGPVLRTKSLKTEVCPRRGPILRTNGRRRRFFGNIYFTNRPLVACSAINPLNNPGVYGTKTYEAAFCDVSFTGRGRERLGRIGRYREISGKIGRTVNNVPCRPLAGLDCYEYGLFRARAAQSLTGLAHLSEVHQAVSPP